MTLEPKSRQVSFTSVIAQARDDAIRETNGQAQTAATMVDEDSHTSRTYSLYRPFDVRHLSDRQCYVRRELIEVFHADSHAEGRVALRCKFCHHVPYADRATGSMIFPRSLSVLCTSVGLFQSAHIQKCQHIPQAKKDMWSTLSSTPVGGQAKKYWIESAKKIGLADAENHTLGAITPCVTMKCDSSTLVADATQSESNRYTRIKKLAIEILSEQQQAEDEMADATNTATAPFRKRKRIKHGSRPRRIKLPVDPRRTCPEHMKNRAGRVGVYLPEARKERIARFHSKREDRIARFYSKDILYEVRRNKANATKRVNGRFVKQSEKEVNEIMEAEAEAETPDDASQVMVVGGDRKSDQVSDSSDTEDDSTVGENEEEVDVLIASVIDEEGAMEDIPVAKVLCE